jgi:hypothetical protein
MKNRLTIKNLAKTFTIYANWWNAEEVKDKKTEIVDSTPDEIKNNDVYKDMIKRFLSGSFKDKSLEQERNERNVRNERNGTMSDVGRDLNDTKEWEGVYQNKLDD